LIEQGLRVHQHSIGYTGDGFYRSKDPTNSIKVLKEHIDYTNNRKIQQAHTDTKKNIANTLVYTNMGMARTEGRATKPEQRWDCCCGTPNSAEIMEEITEMVC